LEFVVKLRNRILTCALACLTALSGVVSAAAGAQTERAPAFAPAYDSSGGKSLRSGYGAVVYLDENGMAVCRTASDSELRSILTRSGEKRLIYSGAPRMRAPGGKIVDSPLAAEVETDTGQLALAPSAGLHIFLHGTTQLEGNQEAKNAFIVAANRWEARISTPINVVIDVDFGTTFFGTPFSSSGVIGATGTADMGSPLSNVRARLLANSPTAAEQAVYNALPTDAVPTESSVNGFFRSTSVRLGLPNARALGLVDDIANPAALDIGDGDAGIGFNSAFGFDFNPDDGITAGKMDFDSVATHEIGHALGFSSEAGGGFFAPVSMWDLFRFRESEASVAAFGTTRRIMDDLGTQVYFNGQTNTFGTQELKLSTGGPDGNASFGDGNQSSHWKADELSGGQYIGIMDPTIARGVRKATTENDFKALDSFGYSLDAAVPHPAPPPAPPTGPPSNDNFASSVAVTGASGFLIGSNFGATKQAGEPTNPANAGGRSVWYTWTPPVSGSASVNTQGSTYDTILAVYAGDSFGNLTLIGSNDDIQPGFVNSSVSFNAVAGVTYRISVDGFVNSQAVGADSGFIQLNWQGQAPPASFIQFSSTDYSANENAGTANVTLTRTGDTSTPQSVGFFTDTTGTATSGVDFNPASGLVSFNPGETSKTVSVGIIDDSATESNETVVLRLNNPSGGVALGTPSAATLTIVDDDAIGPNTVQFNAAAAAVAEGAGKVTLTATRTGDLAHAATVAYKTFDGTARDRLDYTAAAGTLRFGANETTKSFDVLITDDKFAEGAETFTVGLGTTFQTTVGAQNVVTITINDNDSATATSPVRWDSNFDVSFFVRQHYADFLNREADAPGLSFWTGQMTGCGNANTEVCRVNVSGAFFQAIEFQETGYLAERTYKTAYGDATGTAKDGNGNPVQIFVPVIRLDEFVPDTRRLGENFVVGQGDWQGQLEANKQAYMVEFVQRQRFLDAYPLGTDAFTLVNKLNQNTGNTLSAADAATIANNLSNSGVNLPGPRAVALRAVAENAVLRQSELNRAFVLMQYFGYLRRNPNDTPDSDYTGYNFWLSKLNQFQGNFVAAEMVKAFLTSDEYSKRFGN
jgi:Calx-beta domain